MFSPSSTLIGRTLCFPIYFYQEGILLDLTANNKKKVDNLKIEWNRLWRERRDDKVRAEGIAVNDYNQLFIDQGTIIRATRDFKSLSFKEILEQNGIADADRYIPPDPCVGGWTKFIKDNLNKRELIPKAHKNKNSKTTKQQSKQGGKGWLHAE